MAEQPAKPKANLVEKFQALTDKPIEDQTEFFLKSFIFDLGDNWKELGSLEKDYRKRLRDSNEGKSDLNPIMAADFLQKHGLERTALQRKEEVKDIDLDNNDRIAFIEYLLLHYKVMILQAYYKRTGEQIKEDLGHGGVGVTGVGAKLLDELFTLPMGLDPELEKAIEEFTAKKKARESKLTELNDKAVLGGVKGMAAANEIKQMENADMTDMNRIEITLNAAKKKGMKSSGEEALAKKKQEEEAAARQKQEESKAKLAAKAAMFEHH